MTRHHIKGYACTNKIFWHTVSKSPASKLKTNDHNAPEQNDITANVVRLAVVLKITRKLEAASREASPAKELREYAMSAESIAS